MALAEKDRAGERDKLEKLTQFCNERLIKLYSSNVKSASHGKVAIAMLKDVA